MTIWSGGSTELGSLTPPVGVDIASDLAQRVLNDSMWNEFTYELIFEAVATVSGAGQSSLMISPE